MPVGFNDYLQPHVREGRYMRELDEQIMKEQSSRAWGIALTMIALFVIVMTPYYALKNAFVADEVLITELNASIRNDPSIDWATEQGEGVYGIFDSLEAAEDWLLKNGYKMREIRTRHFSGMNWRAKNPDSYWKSFPVKGQVVSPEESVIGIVIDYGDDKPRLVPFHYTDETTPLNLSRFDRPAVPRHWNGERPRKDKEWASCAFELGVYSTHDTMSGWERMTGDWPCLPYNPSKYDERRKNYFEGKPY